MKIYRLSCYTRAGMVERTIYTRSGWDELYAKVRAAGVFGVYLERLF